LEGLVVVVGRTCPRRRCRAEIANRWKSQQKAAAEAVAARADVQATAVRMAAAEARLEDIRAAGLDPEQVALMQEESAELGQVVDTFEQEIAALQAENSALVAKQASTTIVRAALEGDVASLQGQMANEVRLRHQLADEVRGANHSLDGGHYAREQLQERLMELESERSAHLPMHEARATAPRAPEALTVALAAGAGSTWSFCMSTPWRRCSTSGPRPRGSRRRSWCSTGGTRASARRTRRPRR
jgi:chromosome segregation ATPase